MPSYVIVGASRGIGYSFLDVLAKDPANTVFGLVRNVEPTQKQVEADGLKNVTILHADLTDYNSLLAAADKVSSVVGGSGVDYLWLNGAYISMVTAERFLDEFSPDEYSQLLDELQTSWTTNVVGTINAINAFLPLVQKSSIKKVVAISTGMADNSLISKCGIWEGAPYSISKAALNTVIAKYDARFRSQGLLFLALSPGMVDTGGKLPEGSQLPVKFFNFNPSMTGPITPLQSVTAMLKLIAVCDAEHDGGQFYSHLGKHQGWLNSA